jgi:tRNA C32,U32 (ribose-2'-O)-methylase TrmJ
MKSLSLCHQQILIATNPGFSSLNIASAVQLICYEFNLANIDFLNLVQKSSETAETAEIVAEINLSNLATVNEMELFYQHLERVMLKTEFMDPKQPKLLMRRLRRLFNRAEISQQELNILRGIFTACEKFIPKNNI